MIRHYLTLAFRNLQKYKMQNFISIMGLAVGFVCFVLANLWIHYEMNYDQGMKDLDRTYLLYQKAFIAVRNPYTTLNSWMAAPTLRREYPEIEAACGYVLQDKASVRSSSGTEMQLVNMRADSAFFTVYPAAGNLLQGSMDFLYQPQHIALTETAAKRLQGSAHVLGDSIYIDDNTYLVSAILRDVDRHSNLYFDCWMNIPENDRIENWGSTSCYTLVRLRPGVDVAAFVEKIRNYTSSEEWNKTPLTTANLIPLAQYHSSEINAMLPVRLHYLYLFSVTGVLVIACALFNYLSLFAMRLHTRVREIELRRVCGSSTGRLLALFSAEYLPVLLLAGALSMSMVELSLPAFRRLSQITGNVYNETLLYFAVVLFVSLVCLLPFVLRKHRRTFKRGVRFTASKMSIWLQLFICLLFIFCISVLQKQLHHLTTGDLGWERHNTAILNVPYSQEAASHFANPSSFHTDGYEEISKAIDEMPFITAALKGRTPLFPPSASAKMTFDKWDGKQDESAKQSFNIVEGVDYIQFYQLKLKEGEMIKKDEAGKVMINEAGVRALGMEHPVGKKLGDYTIVGVIKDYYAIAPTLPVHPTLFWENSDFFSFMASDFILKYREGAWGELKQQIDSLYATLGLPMLKPLKNVEEEYNTMLDSEYMLLRLLGLASLTCVLIAMFGVFSLVSLSCQQRRKEIAIRKVNGARVKDVLALFAREYLLLLVTAAVVAFPVGYALMKRWLQNYSDRIAISWWLYPAIFAAVALLIALCIGWRVWRTARINPADMIKSE